MRRAKWLGVVLLCLLAVQPLFSAAIAEEAVQYRNVIVKTTAQTVDMGKTVVKDLNGFMDFLSQLPNLRSVDMYSTKLSGSQMDELTARFPDVSFGVTLRISHHSVRTDATAFSTLHRTSSDPHKSQVFEALKYCKNLQALDLGHNAITDISFLRDLPNLKILILACNKLTDISVLAELEQLEYLELFKNSISDLTPLTGLSNLKDLNICFNAVEDWKPLESMTFLERLWVYRSAIYADKTIRLTDEVVDALKKALPDTEVNSTSYSTQGGWREHHRYTDISDIFKTGVYHDWTAQ